MVQASLHERDLGSQTRDFISKGKKKKRAYLDLNFDYLPRERIPDPMILGLGPKQRG